MFSNKDLRNLIVPFFLEQLLMALVGMADVFVVGLLGEAAVSGVSRINAFNMIFMNLFTALAAGGAVVISQYIGRKDNRRAGEAVSQLLLAAVLFSVAISVVVLLHNLFSALAFPFADPLGKGLRAAGDVRFTTVTSLFPTIGVRLVFSILFAIVLHMGVVGIACAMCLDWVVRGVIFWLRFRQGKWKNYRVI